MLIGTQAGVRDAKRLITRVPARTAPPYVATTSPAKAALVPVASSAGGRRPGSQAPWPPPGWRRGLGNAPKGGGRPGAAGPLGPPLAARHSAAAARPRPLLGPHP